MRPSVLLPRLIKNFDSKLDEIIQEDLPILKKIKKHVIQSGGKRIRPLTHYFLCQLHDYKGSIWKDVGAIAELIHGASLLHDDVVDLSELRRGKPTVGALYGNKTAILGGDYLLACGIDHLNRLNQPEIMAAYTKVIRDLSVGELIQMEWEKNPKITLAIYESVIYGKTASLFGAVSISAGILSGLKGKPLEKIHNFGIQMGLLFQRKDDYIDYFDDSKKSGKIPLKDFMNGLYTYPILLLQEKLKKNDLKIIHDLLKKEMKSAEDKAMILHYLEAFNIQSELLTMLKNDGNSLIQYLSELPESDIRKLFIEKIEELIN
ncbi:MAG: polyprenyl synthetase family protein [Leptospiraceae bacterium]|nr:polyprenyl synthetase family protein [Leptospiraceae bacterium]MCP5513047.1 polyprenyl synthetase family protein [Leptospiraceae bacterium]